MLLGPRFYSCCGTLTKTSTSWFPERRRRTIDRALTTRRLALAPLDSTEFGPFRALLHDPDVRRYLCDDALPPDERIAAWVQESEEAFSNGGAGIWVIRSADSDHLVGFVGFMNVYDPPVRELTFGLYPEHWGRGFAIEAARAAIAWARAHAGYATIRASTDEPNASSVRTLERLGFVLRSDSFPPGASWRQLHFELPGDVGD